MKRPSLNHVYRLIWNQRLQAWVPVAECTAARGKRARPGLAQHPVRSVPLYAAMMLIGLAPPALALPSGEQVAAGSANFQRDNNQLNIQQTSRNAVVNWRDFSIGRGESVTIEQPNSNAAMLARVQGTTRSEIDGSLQANGKLYLINKNGILVGPDGSVDTAGFTASTLDVADETFMAGGEMRFSGDSQEGIVNLGTLHAGDGNVTLMAHHVDNAGTISAANGNAELLAGNELFLASPDAPAVLVKAAASEAATGAANSGLIEAAQARLQAADGNLYALAINQTGTVRATGVDTRGGRILLTADGGTVVQDGTLTARTADGNGGEIRVGGATGLPTATETVVTANASLDADATAPTGNGGRVIVLADDTADINGRLSARAGSESGDGGFIETSAARVKIADDAVITTQAENGQSGTWLIDPIDFTIASGSGALTTSGIGATTLSNSLGTGNVSIATDAGTAGNGDIFVNSAVSWSANKLTLTAHRNIAINANLNGSGTASLALEYGQNAVAAGNTAVYSLSNGAKVSLPAGANFSTKLGSDGVTTPWTVITSLGTAASSNDGTLQGMVGNLAGKYALGADINASDTSNNWNGGTGFTPVGPDSACGSCFTGKFDGLGHTISNLFIDRNVNAPVGLFGGTNNAVLQNVGLLNLNLHGGTDGTGALVGRAMGSTIIRNSYADGGSVKSYSHYAGGLVGVAINSTNISYSYANVSVESSNGGNASDARAGGLVGANGGSISYSYATGSVTGNAGIPAHNNGIGGLVGMQTNAGSISNSYATGAVSAVGGGTNLGGLVGEASGSGGSVTSSYWDKTTTGQATSADVTGGGGGDGTGLTTAEWLTIGPFGTTPSSGAWSSADWGAGNPYPGIKALPYITITASASQTYGSAATFGIASILDQTGTDATSLVNTGGLTWSAGTTASTAAGTTSAVRGSGATGTGYQILYAGNLTVGKAPLTVTAGSVSKTYDGLAWSGNNGVSYSSFVNGETSAVLGGTLAYGGSSQGAVDAGSYAITPSGLTSVNYAISYANGTLTVDKVPLTITANAASKTYDGLAWSGGNGISYAGLVNGETSAVLGGTLAYGGNSQGAVNVGSYAITPSGLTATNYTIGYADGTLTINPAPVIFVPTSISGSLTGSVGKVYDGTTAATLNPGNFLLTGFVGNDGATVTKTSGTYASPNAGSGIMVTIDLAASDYAAVGNTILSNYSLPTHLSGAVGFIDKLDLAITGLSAANKVYDGTVAAVLTGNAAVAPLVDDDVMLTGTAAGTFADTLVPLDGKNAGTGKPVTVSGLALSGADAGNYTLLLPIGLSADITAKTLLAHGTAIANKVYDGTTTATISGGALDGLIAGDDVGLLQEAAFADKNAGNGKTVNVAYSLDGGDAGNYALDQAAATLTADIEPRVLTLTGLGVSDKVYDGTTQAKVSGKAKLTGKGKLANIDVGLVGGETVTVAKTGKLGAHFADKNAGTDKQATIEGFTIADGANGGLAGNYVVGASADITPRDLSVNAKGQNKTYDGTATASVTLTDDRIKGDELTADYASATFADRNAGKNKKIRVEGITLSGTDAGNYAANATAKAKAAILPKPLTVNPLIADKVYDGTQAASITGFDLEGLVADENLTVKAKRAQFDNRNVGDGKIVNVSGIRLTDGDNGLAENYTAATTANGTASITAKP